MLGTSINDIRWMMTYDKNYRDWINTKTTNCYAFALGIDIPQSRICKCAFQVGNIAHCILDTPIVPLFNDSQLVEQCLLLDFRALGINYEASQSECGLYYQYQQEFIGRYWDILFFVRVRNNHICFHFARIGKDGQLYHKRGYHYRPEQTTFDDIESDGYQFVRRYRLSLDSRNNAR